MHVRQVALTTA